MIRRGFSHDNENSRLFGELDRERRERERSDLADSLASLMITIRRVTERFFGERRSMSLYSLFESNEMFSI